MPLSEAAKEKLRRKTRDENGNVLPHIHERLKKAHEVRREKKRQRKEQAERAKELEKLRQEAEEARKKREIEDLKREIGGDGGARKEPERRDEAPRQAGAGNQEAQGRAPAQEADPAHHGHDAGEKPPAPDGGRSQEVHGEESAPQPASRPHEPSQPGGVRERGPDGDGGDTVGEVDKGTKDKIAAYAFPNSSIAKAAPSAEKQAKPAKPAKPTKPTKPLPVNRVII
jgi:hypothetical protein